MLTCLSQPLGQSLKANISSDGNFLLVWVNDGRINTYKIKKVSSTFKALDWGQPVKVSKSIVWLVRELTWKKKLELSSSIPADGRVVYTHDYQLLIFSHIWNQKQ